MRLFGALTRVALTLAPSQSRELAACSRHQSGIVWAENRAAENDLLGSEPHTHPRPSHPGRAWLGRPRVITTSAPGSCTWLSARGPGRAGPGSAGQYDNLIMRTRQIKGLHLRVPPAAAEPEQQPLRPIRARRAAWRTRSVPAASLILPCSSNRRAELGPCVRRGKLIAGWRHLLRLPSEHWDQETME